MISELTGTVSHKDVSHAVLDVNGVGYKVNMTGNLVSELTLGDTAKVITHLVVREDCLDLYGFRDREELRIFELLLTVSGIGPKSALGILNVTAIETLKHAVYSEDISHLTKISGIGKKIAEKIILELRGKFDDMEGSGYLKDDSDVMEALRSLGYSQRESQEALKQVPRDVVGASEKVKYALKHLS